MHNQRQQLGKSGETLALHYLKARGYRIVERNYRTRLGEIDLIARDGATTVFIEVKTRRSPHYGNPKYAITPSKQAKMSKVALHYLKTKQLLNVKARFDVVTITWHTSTPQIDLLTNAFDVAYP